MGCFRPIAMVLLASLAACDRDEPLAAAKATSAPTAPTTVAIASMRRPPVIPTETADQAPRGRRVVAEAAFDLVTAPGGAVLTWADAQGVHLVDIDEEGRLAPPRLLAEVAGVRELAATTSGDRLAVVWVAGRGPEARIESVVGQRSTSDFEPVRRRAATTSGPPTGERGLLAVDASEGRLVAFARTRDAPCRGYDRPTCANFSIIDLDDARSLRPRPGLEVPHPGTRPVVGLAVSAVHWHYAINHRGGPAPQTVVFTAQESPSYAQTHDLLTGCQPMGMTRHGADVWLAGRCGGDRRVAHLRGLELSAGTVSPGETARCSRGLLTLTLGSRDVALTHEVVGLGGLLPERWAPPSTRAVWTGETLLVAHAEGERLVLDQLDCDEGELHPRERQP